MSYEIQHNTLCDGWVNTWTNLDDDSSVTFETEQEAQAAFDEYWADVTAAVARGDMEPYERDDFRIAEVRT